MPESQSASNDDANVLEIEIPLSRYAYSSEELLGLKLGESNNNTIGFSASDSAADDLRRPGGGERRQPPSGPPGRLMRRVEEHMDRLEDTDIIAAIGEHSEDPDQQHKMIV